MFYLHTSVDVADGSYNYPALSNPATFAPANPMKLYVWDADVEPNQEFVDPDRVAREVASL